jgi:hypothetical protein
MISNVSYPAVPTVGFRKVSEILGTLVVLATLVGVLFLRTEFYFPALVLYVLYGLGKTVLFGLLDRRPKGDSPVISDDDDDDEPLRLTTAPVLETSSEAIHQRSHRRRRRRRPPGGPGDSRGGNIPPGGSGGPV